MIRLIPLCCAAVVMAGCSQGAAPGDSYREYAKSAASARSEGNRSGRFTVGGFDVPAGSSGLDGDGVVDALGDQLARADEPGKGADQPAVERKIVYEARVTLVVDDFAETQKRVSELVAQFKGYVASSEVDRSQGEYRTGRWTVRIPVDQFQPFLDAASDLGVPETVETKAQDVTEEFVDLEARATNKREVERRLIKILEERTGEVKDVVTVETELGRVREEIERIEGRLRYLANVTAMTTVTIAVREERDYQPPQAPSFGQQIGSTWSRSLAGLAAAGKSLVLAGVAMVPWLPVAAVVLVPGGWLVRRWHKRPRSA